MPVHRSSTYPPAIVQLSTISTPREHLLKLRPGPASLEIIEQAEQMHIYQLLVLTDEGDLAGLIPLTRLKELYGSNEMVDAARAKIRVPELPGHVPLLHLLDAMAEHGAVVHRGGPDDHRDPDWFAMITNADLNRPIFRANVYLVLARLETVLGELIMDEFGDDWGAIRLLSEHTQRRVRDFYEDAKAEGVELSPVVQLTLSEMFHISASSREVWKLCGYASPKDMAHDGSIITDTRNHVMHPIQPLINRNKDVSELRDVVRLVLDLTERIQQVTP